MRKAIRTTTVAAFLVCLATAARAQNTSDGQAFSAQLSIGPPPPAIDQSDTGPQSAPNAATPKPTPGPGCPPSTSTSPDSYDVCAGGSTVPAAPVANVVTGPSRTRGCASPTGCPDLFPSPAPTDALDASFAGEIFAHSEAGNATAEVFPGQAPGPSDVLDAVTSGATATASCNGPPSADAFVDALVIAGNPVPLQNPGANTTVIAPGFPLIVLNEQTCSQPTATSSTCAVNALHAQVFPVSGGTVVDLKLSGASAAVTCPEVTPTPTTTGTPGTPGPTGTPGPGCQGNFTNSSKDAEVENPDGTHKASQIPQANDRIRYTVHVANSGCAASAVTVVDRIPIGTTFADTVTVGGSPAPAQNVSIGTCTADELAVSGCSTSPQQQCLRVQVPNVAPSTTVDVGFTVSVDSTSTGGQNPGCDNSGVGEGICNTALIEAPGANTPVTPRTNTIICPIPSGPPGGAGTPTGTRGPTNDSLVTTGSGGCSLGDGSGPIGPFPVISVALLLALRQWRRRASSAK